MKTDIQVEKADPASDPAHIAAGRNAIISATKQFAYETAFLISKTAGKSSVRIAHQAQDINQSQHHSFQCSNHYLFHIIMGQDNINPGDRTLTQMGRMSRPRLEQPSSKWPPHLLCEDH